MSVKAKAMKTLYRRGKVNAAGLRKAVADNVITPDEYQAITGEAYSA